MCQQKRTCGGPVVHSGMHLKRGIAAAMCQQKRTCGGPVVHSGMHLLLHFDAYIIELLFPQSNNRIDKMRRPAIITLSAQAGAALAKAGLFRSDDAKATIPQRYQYPSKGDIDTFIFIGQKGS